MTEISKFDVELEYVSKQLGVSVAFNDTCHSSVKRNMYFVCTGYLIAVTIDNAFVGESSCMLDLHKVCEKTGFNTIIVATLIGIHGFFLHIGIVGLLMLIQHLMLEIKCRIEKLQECLLLLTRNGVSATGVNSFISVSKYFDVGNTLKVTGSNYFENNNDITDILFLAQEKS